MGFGAKSQLVSEDKLIATYETETRYLFELFYHPSSATW